MFKLQTDYALRTLIYLARTNARAPVQEIAAAYGISRDHLFKVVQQLVRMGFVVTRPGRNGGVRLGRDAGGIRCGDVIAGFEGRNGLLACATVAGDETAASRDVRAVHDAMAQAEAALYDALQRITIAEMARHGAGPPRLAYRVA